VGRKKKLIDGRTKELIDDRTKESNDDRTKELNGDTTKELINIVDGRELLSFARSGLKIYCLKRPQSLQ
jgi:hypothetical protein